MDGSEAESDLVLIQPFFALLWKSFLKNTSKHKDNLIYIINQEGCLLPVGVLNPVMLYLNYLLSIKYLSGVPVN